MFSVASRSALALLDKPTSKKSATRKWPKISQGQACSSRAQRTMTGRSRARARRPTTKTMLSRRARRLSVSRALHTKHKSTSRYRSRTTNITSSRCSRLLTSLSTTRRSSILLRTSMRSPCRLKWPEEIDPRQAQVLSLPSSTQATHLVENPRSLFTDMQVRGAILNSSYLMIIIA